MKDSKFVQIYINSIIKKGERKMRLGKKLYFFLEKLQSVKIKT